MFCASPACLSVMLPVALQVDEVDRKYILTQVSASFLCLSCMIGQSWQQYKLGKLLSIGLQVATTSLDASQHLTGVGGGWGG